MRKSEKLEKDFFFLKKKKSVKKKKMNNKESEGKGVKKSEKMLDM